MYFQSDFVKLILLGLILTFFGCDRGNNINEPDDGLAPAIPSGIRVFYSNDGVIELEWINNNEGDLKGYNIYRSVNDTSHFRILGYTNSDYYVDDSLYYDSTYYYYITAIDDKNRESSPTSVVSGKPLNRFIPLAVRNIQINARNWNNVKEIYLWWDRSREPDIKGYNIYRSLSQNFSADSTTLLAFSPSVSYIDTFNLELYQTYYYRITALDLGKFESNSIIEVSDLILEPPVILFPANNAVVDYFEKFKIGTVGAPARYRVILQTNQYFGEVWSTEIISNEINSVIDVELGYGYMERNKTYYWRVAAYSGNSSEPNSITNLYNFTIKP